jgi:hypothetical protein
MAERQEELWMSRKDRDRLKVLHEVRKRHITQVQAGKELAISPRWVRELLQRMKARGDRAVVHGLRGTSEQSVSSVRTFVEQFHLRFQNSSIAA